MSDVAIFVSYAHVDDSAIYGRIKVLVSDVANWYMAVSGREVGTVFIDTESIKLGEDWRERIRAGLGSATILLVFASPSYLRSAACRAELREFLSFLPTVSEKRLILPLLLVDQGRMDRLFPNDDLWKSIVSLQYLPIEHLKFEDKGSPAWMTAVDAVAVRVEEKLIENAQVAEVASDDVASADGDGLSLESGIFDRIAEAEGKLPLVVELTNEYSEVIAQYGQLATEVTPKMSEAKSFGERAAVAQRFAEDLQPIAERALDLSRKLDELVRSVDPGIVAAVRFVKAAPDAQSAQSRKFLQQTKGFANSGMYSTDSASKLAGEIAKVKGYSAQLDGPISDMQEALLLTAETRAIYRIWIGEIDNDLAGGVAD